MNLLESLQCLITEGQQGNYVVNKYPNLVEPLYQRFESDPDFDMEVIDKKTQDISKQIEAGSITQEEAKKRILKLILDEVEKKYPNIAKNMYWTMKQYANAEKQYFHYHDFDRVDKQLEFFEKAKNRKKLENPNILEYDYTKFKDTVAAINPDDLKSANEKKKEGREEVKKALNSENPEEFKSKDFEIVWNTPELIVFHPFTYQGSVACIPTRAKYNGESRACEWCTRASLDCNRWGTNGEGHFNRYNEQGPLFPMHDLVHDDWYQLHFTPPEWKDWVDNEISDYDKFIESRPHVKEFIIDYVTKHPQVVKKYKSTWAKYLDKSKLDPDLADWLAYSGSNLDFIREMREQGKDIPEKTKYQIIDEEPMLITAIKAPSIDLQQKALDRNPRAVRRTAPDEIRRLALQRDPTIIYDFASVNVRINGEVKTLTANELLNEDDIKTVLSERPLLLSILIGDDDRFSKFKTEENIKFAITADAKKDSPERIDLLLGKRLSPEIKEWAKPVYEAEKAKREAKKQRK